MIIAYLYISDDTSHKDDGELSKAVPESYAAVCVIHQFIYSSCAFSVCRLSCLVLHMTSEILCYES